MKVVHLKFDGKLVVNTEEVLSNWLIFIEASNGDKWGGGEKYFVDLSTLAPKNSLAGFKREVSTLKIDLYYEKENLLTTIELPETTE